MYRTIDGPAERSVADASPLPSPSSVTLARIGVVVLVAIGVAATLLVFWPGIMTRDASFVYSDIGLDQPGDWQSPVMVWVWGLIDPIAPGATSMFLLITALYWLGFATISFALTRDHPALALIPPILAMTPPAFELLGMVWRDVILGGSWLLAVAVIYLARNARGAPRFIAVAISLLLIAFGLLLRPNALFAAPLLAIYAFWPRSFSWRRAALAYVPLVVLGFALSQFVYYTLLDARRQNILHAIFVFDIGGITHYTKQNWFPVEWTESQMRLLQGACYSPTQWDTFWTFDPCRFVMQKLDFSDIFGRPVLFEAWKKAVLANPGAYLRHRFGHFWTLLTSASPTISLEDLSDEELEQHPDNKLLHALGQMDAAINQTIVFRVGFWFLIAIGLFAAALRFARQLAGAFLIASAASSIFYIATYLPVGVSTTYRYGYWPVLASLVGLVVLAAAIRDARATAGPKIPAS